MDTLKDFQSEIAKARQTIAGCEADFQAATRKVADAEAELALRTQGVANAEAQVETVERLARAKQETFNTSGSDADRDEVVAMQPVTTRAQMLLEAAKTAQAEAETQLKAARERALSAQSALGHAGHSNRFAFLSHFEPEAMRLAKQIDTFLTAYDASMATDKSYYIHRATASSARKEPWSPTATEQASTTRRALLLAVGDLKWRRFLELLGA